jgi:hypothetical protein
VRVPAQARLVVGPAGQQHQHARARDPVEREADQLQRGRVDPVRVLEHHQHRPVACQPERLLDEGGERADAPLLRGQVKRRVAVARLDPEQCGDERHGLVGARRSRP